MVDSLERGSTQATGQPPLNLGDFTRLDEKVFNKLAHSDIPSDLDSISSPYASDKRGQKDERSETSQAAATKDGKEKQTDIGIRSPRASHYRPGSFGVALNNDRREAGYLEQPCQCAY